MLKQDKKEFVKNFTEVLKGKELILIDYEGLTVADANEIRSQCYQIGSKITIVKNTLLKKSLQNNDVHFGDSLMKGMSAIISISDNFSEVGKIVLNAEKDEKVKIKAGYYEGNVIDMDYVKKLASIPSRNVLYSMLVGALAGPISNLTYTLQGIVEQK